jgi:hypothetical protein
VGGKGVRRSELSSRRFRLLFILVLVALLPLPLLAARSFLLLPTRKKFKKGQYGNTQLIIIIIAD